MDERLGILHVSDLHASRENKATIQGLVEHLKTDIAMLQVRHNVSVKMICFSGDLINSGDNADEELNIALEVFLQPLMDMLQLDEKSIFIVAGNHEIKRQMIVPYIETGLNAILVSEAAIDDFLKNINSDGLKRVEYFDSDFGDMFGGDLVWKNSLGRAYMFSVGTLKIGVSCLNSAWRSTGIGSAEKRKMVIGRKQIIDSFEKIKTADLKICIAHHPFDWLVDEDKSAVEKCISQYDIVLTGHIHESDTKLFTSFNGQTLFNTCGKFDNTSDIYNGYSLLAVNPYNKNCDVILRQHFDFPRNCFDEALCVAQGGTFSTSLGTKDDKLALAYNVAHSTETKFLEYANSYFVSNVSAGRVLRSFDESFIIPELSKHSEYEKETKFDNEAEGDPDDTITLDEICRSKKNILFLGKKEIGKTTILHYIAKFYFTNFNFLKSVPVIIDSLYTDFTGKNVIPRAIHKFINEYCDGADSFSMDNVETLLSAGLFTIMFDNFETVEERQLAKINQFLSDYSNNRFIFSEKENITSKYLREVEVVPSCDYDTTHICALSKGQIRAIATQNFSTGDCSALVEKIMLCFKKTTLPKTPFVLSLMLSICDTADFTPINEAVIMEQFMEHLLEKSSPTEAYSTTYDFRIKEDFLIYIVSYMNENNHFILSIDEFEALLSSYHVDKGFSVRETEFDTLFFKKGVLIRTELIVTFRYNCMIEYYLAKKAAQIPEFLDHMLSDRNYLNYSNELMYYTGLNRQNVDVVKKLQKMLYADFDKLKGVVTELDDYKIGIDISLPEESFTQKIGESKLTQAQSDRLQDTKDSSELQTPVDMNKQVTHEDMDSFIQTLLIYGSCLKNLELLPKREKALMYDDYLLALRIMLGIFKKSTEDYFNNEVSEMEQFPEKYTDEDIRRLKILMQDVLKIAMPVVLQNIALENIGTTKLKAIIEGVIQNKDGDDFSRFFSVFLFGDLHLPGLQKVLKDYCTEANNKSLLKIIFFKLLYYYRFRYFSPSLDPFFENMLADINIKLNGGNKHRKSMIVCELKKQKKFNIT
ncbi:MAG: metallophosphoesterase [Christensenellaceae bacterium]